MALPDTIQSRLAFFRLRASLTERGRTAAREAAAVVVLSMGILTTMSLLSYTPDDVSLNQAWGQSAAPPANWIGPMGATWADLCLQVMGVAAWMFNVALLWVGGRMLLGRHRWPSQRQIVATAGLAASCGTLIELLTIGNRSSYPLGGVFGALLARCLRELFAPVGAATLAATGALLSLTICLGGVLSSLARRAGAQLGLWHGRARDHASAAVRHARVKLTPARLRALLAASAAARAGTAAAHDLAPSAQAGAVPPAPGPTRTPPAAPEEATWSLGGEDAPGADAAGHPEPAARGGGAVAKGRPEVDATHIPAPTVAATALAAAATPTTAQAAKDVPSEAADVPEWQRGDMAAILAQEALDASPSGDPANEPYAFGEAHPPVHDRAQAQAQAPIEAAALADAERGDGAGGLLDEVDAEPPTLAERLDEPLLAESFEAEADPGAYGSATQPSTLEAATAEATDVGVGDDAWRGAPAEDDELLGDDQALAVEGGEQLLEASDAQASPASAAELVDEPLFAFDDVAQDAPPGVLATGAAADGAAPSFVGGEAADQTPFGEAAAAAHGPLASATHELSASGSQAAGSLAAVAGTQEAAPPSDRAPGAASADDLALAELVAEYGEEAVADLVAQMKGEQGGASAEAGELSALAADRAGTLLHPPGDGVHDPAWAEAAIAEGEASVTKLAEATTGGVGHSGQREGAPEAPGALANEGIVLAPQEDAAAVAVAPAPTPAFEATAGAQVDPGQATQAVAGAERNATAGVAVDVDDVAQDVAIGRAAASLAEQQAGAAGALDWEMLPAGQVDDDDKVFFDEAAETGALLPQAPAFAHAASAQAQQGPADGTVGATASAEPAAPPEAETMAEADLDVRGQNDDDFVEGADEAFAGLAATARPQPLPYVLPPLDLMHFEADALEPVDPAQLQANAAKLTRTLADYGIEGHVREIRPGPVVTLYEFVPGPGIKLAKIVSLADDLAMSMEAFRVRIVAPIPGKGAVGIEIPNEGRELVHLKEIVGDAQFRDAPAPLTMALGKDIEGQPCMADLARMPHLLVAGATGAGKSVSVNAMIMSVLFKATPDEVRMIMVDPKMLELSVYEGIPHLLLPVVTDPKKAALALRWAVQEMERRYELLSEVGVRSIDGFNAKVRAGQASGVPVTVAGADEDMPRKVCNTLPYLLVVVDELADLMMVASREVEASIMRLAQMARAAGIHLILATQRPSVDVLTGVIKANFPTRIAFQVASRHDSRTIIDANGAEHLLGRGDMLFMSSAAGGIKRVHGAFVSEADIERTVAFVRKQGEPSYDESILAVPAEEADEASVGDYGRDEMYDQAVAIVAETQQASISMIQRRLRIGYNRAARMVECMEQEGIVGPGDGQKPREVFVHQQPTA